MKVRTKERIEKEGTAFFPLMEVQKDYIRDGEFLRNLSANLQKRGFPDFFVKEEGLGGIVIWVPEDAAEHIVGVSCSKISVDVHWSKL
jgi:hypothetical protein